MGSIGALFALFVAGYLIGVWTACAVLGQGQRVYEDGSPGTASLVLDPSIPEGSA